jgi:hypothetical protein
MLVIRKKKCSKCDNEKLMTFENFGWASENHDCGLRSECKACRKIYLDEYSKEYYKNNTEQIQQNSRNYKQNNKQKRNKYEREKRSKDPLAKLKNNLRSRMGQAVRGSKSKRTTELLGCEITEYKKYLEKKFVNGMNWQNYGEWHIDHIIPLASAENEKQLEKLFHYTNTQPLWGTDNCRKGARL